MNKIVNGYVTNESGTNVKPVRVRRVKPLEPYRAQFTFTDGTKRVIDLDPYLRGPVFEPIRQDPALFKAMFVDDGTVAWPGDIDIDPDTLYFGENPVPWQEERVRRTPPRRSLAHFVQVLQSELPDLTARYHIQSLGLFGSYVRGQEKPRSDLDIVVEYRQPIGVDARYELIDSLSKRLKVKVEVIQKESLPPYIRKRVMREALWLQKDGIALPVKLPHRNPSSRNGRRTGAKMEPEREYLDYIQDMLDNMERVQRFVNGFSMEQVSANIETDYAVRYAMQVIGEAANRIPNDIRKMYPKIPWRAIIDFRNVMAHGYDRMIYREIWDAIHISIPRDKPLVAHMLEAEKKRRGIH